MKNNFFILRSGKYKISTILDYRFINSKQIDAFKKNISKYKVSERDLDQIFSGEDDWLNIKKMIDFSLIFNEGKVKSYGFFDNGIVIADFEAFPKGIGLGENAMKIYRKEFPDFDIIIIKPLEDTVEFWTKMKDKGLIDYIFDDVEYRMY